MKVDPYDDDPKRKKPVDPHWPKWKYHKSGKSKMIHTKATEDALGPDWKDSPAEHGVVTHPHSDEYKAEHGLEIEYPSDEPVEMPSMPAEPPKPRGPGRPKKTE